MEFINGSYTVYEGTVSPVYEGTESPQITTAYEIIDQDSSNTTVVYQQVFKKYFF